MACDLCKPIIASTKKNLALIPQTIEKTEKIPLVIQCLNSSFDFISKNCCTTEKFKDTFINKLKELRSEPYDELKELCDKYLSLFEIPKENLYNFYKIDVNKERAIYETKINDKKYIAKINRIDKEDKEELENFPDSAYNSDIEISVYKYLKDCNHIPKSFHTNTRLPIEKTTYHFKIDEHNCFINFENFAKRFSTETGLHYSIIVMEKLDDYEELWYYLGKITEKDAKAEKTKIFKQVLRIQHKLNQTYGFIHGDLSVTNIFIKKNEDNSYSIKLFDFDMSSINGLTSIRRSYFDTPKPGFTSDAKRGFLLDFYRLYTSFLMRNTFLLEDINDTKELIKIYDKYDRIYQKFIPYSDGVFNDLMPFAEWLLKDRYYNILDIIKS